ncbi:flagellin N-terminal helical domain-containing protein [Nodularia spumigena]|uniref:flagellin N-terminal helical domain-containing protein n=1 Tax=Nodularia spumigena TaxID=70799 RepID=UPI002B1F73AA|nr:flagellin [Nodularia spumigena]MEA5557593.1 flagellin [Nodularia spumigena CH309]
MSRINTNIGSMVGQRILGNNNNALGNSLQRLSTGLRINRGGDDPAGLIASENLRSDLSGLNAAIGNASRADLVVNIAEGGLQEVSGLLTELQGLITTSASSGALSPEEKKANQLQIDSIVQSIDRISSSTSFQGFKLLNGNFDYQVEGINNGVERYSVNAAKLANGGSLDVEVLVTQSAQQGQLYMSFGGGTLDMSGSGEAFTVEITGALGSRELQFSSGTSLADIQTAINSFSDVTGVTASASATGLSLLSNDFGRSQFVSAKIVNDAGVTGSGIFNFEADDANSINAGSATAFTAASNGVRDAGQNVGGTINGLVATAEGKTLSVNSDLLDVELTIDTGTSQNLTSVSAFSITGGGADFQLSGNVDIAGKVSLGIKDVNTRKLGVEGTGFLADLGSGRSLNAIDGNLSDAQKVIDAATKQITGLRGRLGAFQKNAIAPTIRSLNIAVENTTAAESVIRDTDFATETAALTRNQILVSASSNVLAIANSQPQAVLQLLG